MDYAVYFFTAIVTVAWSIWSYLLWERHKELRSESILRSWFMLAPSFWFIAAASAGWGDFFLRLDLIGLVVLVAIQAVSAVVLAGFVLSGKLGKDAYFGVMIGNSIAVFLWVVFLHLVRNYPPLTVQFAVFQAYLSDPDSLFHHLLSVEVAGEKGEIATIFDKALIALLSFIPVAVFRSILLNIKLNKMRKEISILREKVGALEEKIQNSKDPV